MNAHILDEAESDKVDNADFRQAGLVWKRSTTAQHAKRLAIAKWEAEENAIEYHFFIWNKWGVIKHGKTCFFYRLASFINCSMLGAHLREFAICPVTYFDSL